MLFKCWACLPDNLPKEQIKVYSQKIQNFVRDYEGCFTLSYEMTAIIISYLNGLSEEQIRYYKMRGFSPSQIREISYAYRAGLTPEEIEFLANPEFDDLQMSVIRNGFEYGLSFEQIKKFAKPGYYSSDMLEILLCYLWGLSEEVVEFFMKTELPLEKLRHEDRAPELYDTMYFRPQVLLRIALLKGLTIPEIEFIIQRLIQQRLRLIHQEDILERPLSLKAILERFTKDKRARIEIKALLALNTELKDLSENWKRSITESKGKKRSFAL